MSLTEIVITFLLGFGFGWALDKAGLTKYHKIVNVFRFTDLAVLKFMLSAMVTGMIGIYGLKWLGLVQLTPATPTYIVGNFIGGLIFGVGMAGAGF